METKVIPPEVDVDTSCLEEMEFEIACDIGQLRRQHEASGFPPCQGDPAKWVAWRVGCCGQGAQYRLVCDFCKKVYQNWQAKQAVITCVHCGAVTGGFASFTPLNKKA